MKRKKWKCFSYTPLRPEYRSSDLWVSSCFCCIDYCSHSCPPAWRFKVLQQNASTMQMPWTSFIIQFCNKGQVEMATSSVWEQLLLKVEQNTLICKWQANNWSARHWKTTIITKFNYCFIIWSPIFFPYLNHSLIA